MTKKERTKKTLSILVFLIGATLMAGCNNLVNPSDTTPTDSIQVKTAQEKKKSSDEVININPIMYEAAPSSKGIDWNQKNKVPYPYDSIIEVRGIYYDNDYECWRISKEALKKQEVTRKTPVISELPSSKPNEKIEEEIVTLNNDEVPTIEKPTICKPKQDTIEQSKPNPRAMYKGSKGTPGQPGSQKDVLEDNTDIYVNCWVNREGIVERAEIAKGTENTNPTMLKEALEAAKKSTFKPEPNRSEEFVKKVFKYSYHIID